MDCFQKSPLRFSWRFFPIVVNTVVGLKEVEPELLELARINRGSEFDVFKKIRLPNSLPYMFAGIKVAIVLSVTGAIVAEFVAANEGLGYLVLQANYSLDTAFALVILLILAVLSLGLFWLAELCQRKLAPWSAAVREVEGSFYLRSCGGCHEHLQPSIRVMLVGAIVFAFIMVCSGIAAQAAELTPANIRMDFIIGGKHAPWYVALEKGFYAKRGLSATIQASTGSADTVRTVGSGGADFGFADAGDHDRRQIPRHAGAGRGAVRLRRGDDSLARRGS